MKTAGNPLEIFIFGFLILLNPKIKKQRVPVIVVMYEGQKNPDSLTGSFIKVKYIAHPIMAIRAKTVPLLMTVFGFFKLERSMDESKSPANTTIIDTACGCDNVSPRKSKDKITTIEVKAPAIVPTREEFPIFNPSLYARKAIN